MAENSLTVQEHQKDLMSEAQDVPLERNSALEEVEGAWARMFGSNFRLTAKKLNKPFLSVTVTRLVGSTGYFSQAWSHLGLTLKAQA